jgi:hypothetical protein
MTTKNRTDARAMLTLLNACFVRHRASGMTPAAAWKSDKFGWSDRKWLMSRLGLSSNRTVMRAWDLANTAFETFRNQTLQKTGDWALSDWQFTAADKQAGRAYRDAIPFSLIRPKLTKKLAVARKRAKRLGLAS